MFINKEMKDVLKAVNGDQSNESIRSVDMTRTESMQDKLQKQMREKVLSLYKPGPFKDGQSTDKVPVGEMFSFHDLI